MTEQMELELIGIRAVEPWNKKDKAYALEYFCRADVACPLKDKGECINANFLAWCIYGNVKRTTGWTQRARKYNEFVRDWKAKQADMPIKSVKSNKITFIGDYVWLPYSFINHSDGERQGIRFKDFSGMFRNGQPFMHKIFFTPETIVKLVKLRPQAMMGGEITDYQNKSLPRFLADLRHAVPDLYSESLELCPEIEAKTADIRLLPVTLGWLVDYEFGGLATIDGKKCRIYSSTKRVEFFLDGINDFPSAIGQVVVDLKLPRDTIVYISQDRHDFLKVMDKARETGAIVEGGKEL